MIDQHSYKEGYTNRVNIFRKDAFILNLNNVIDHQYDNCLMQEVERIHRLVQIIQCLV